MTKFYVLKRDIITSGYSASRGETCWKVHGSDPLVSVSSRASYFNFYPKAKLPSKGHDLAILDTDVSYFLASSIFWEEEGYYLIIDL